MNERQMYKREHFKIQKTYRQQMCQFHLVHVFILCCHMFKVLNGYYICSCQSLRLGSRFHKLEALGALMGFLKSCLLVLAKLLCSSNLPSFSNSCDKCIHYIYKNIYHELNSLYYTWNPISLSFEKSVCLQYIYTCFFRLGICGPSVGVNQMWTKRNNHAPKNECAGFFFLLLCPKRIVFEKTIQV